jgi:hypothetical protein
MSHTLLEQEFSSAAERYGVPLALRHKILELLKPLRNGPPSVQEHFNHSLRVGMLAARIADFTHHETRPLFIAGTLHDVGKCQIPIEVLGKTANWTEADALVMHEHVMAGFDLLRGTFDFSAEIMLWHHQFQTNAYPEKLPPQLHKYSNATKVLILEYGRLLALADQYDALNRPNDRFDEFMDGARKKSLMFGHNPDRVLLIERLYQAGIFTA